MDNNWLKISRKNINRIIVYYIILLMLGLIFTCLVILNNSINIIEQKNITLQALIIGFGTALLGSSIFYLRKIYKSCINVEMESPQTEDDHIRQIGILSYYYLRPLFAVVFSLVFHITLKESVNIVTLEEATLSNAFIFVMAFLSFFVGFSSGDIITYFEARSKEISTKGFPK